MVAAPTRAQVNRPKPNGPDPDQTTDAGRKDELGLPLVPAATQTQTMTPDSVRHTIRNRLLLSMGLTVVLSVLMTAFVFVMASATIGTLADRTTELDTMEDGLHALEISLATQETYVFDYALSGREEALDEFEAATQVATLAYADLRAVTVRYPTIREAVEAVHVTSSAWREAWAEPFLRSVGTGRAVSDGIAVQASETLYGPAEEALGSLDRSLEAMRQETAAQVGSAIPTLAFMIVPFGAVMTTILAAIGFWLTRSVSGPLIRLNRTATTLVAGEAVSFQAERDDEIGALADILEQMRRDVGVRYQAAHRDADHAAIFNQLAQLTSFASDEQELVQAAGHALRRLVAADRGDILLANPSQNRLIVSSAWGENAPEPGSLVQVDRIDRCPGIRRSSAFVASDLADDMAVRCPAHPAERGTVACVPMSALGKMVGVIHLEHGQPGTFTPDTMHLAARVAESVGLAMANARLMKTMEGQAMSDSLTGLRNPRFFDPYLEQELEQAQRDRAHTSVIMLDLDNFKTFNDTYGHPAGDEALRTFSRVLGASIRSSDVAARYGGEEFAVALHHAGLEDAQVIAEKIRAAVEQTVVEIGPGRYARITASLGVASTETQIHELRALMAMADAALYRAKESGRNRVEVAPMADEVTVLAAASRRRHGRREDQVALNSAQAHQ
jgi:diguanylate cyclase (GGDEF)-like protein